VFQDRRVYHLSHIDLDGYSCQLLSSYIFKDIKYLNSNYGKEILSRVNAIFEELETIPKDKKIFILITDLNLSENEAEYIEDRIEESHHNIHLQLLDHHITGEAVSKAFSWYYLNDGKSATLITYEFLKKNFGFDKDIDPQLERFVHSVNALDIWLQDQGEPFEYGKVMMRLISSARELNKVMFTEEDSRYKLYMLKEAMKIYTDDSISEKAIYLDDHIHHIKKSFFRKDRNETMDNLLTEYVVELLSNNKAKFTVEYKGYRGILTYMLGNTSIVGNGFLVANSDYQFFMDVSGKGNLSFRANGEMDVSLMAKEIAGGGGHKNASGARVKNFKEQFQYSKVKESMKNILSEKEFSSSLLNFKK
jgi:oligoribonuclease NrnB/cAMP/cGMP phosphodiesterase (DHH superfamily)